MQAHHDAQSCLWSSIEVCNYKSDTAISSMILIPSQSDNRPKGLGGAFNQQLAAEVLPASLSHLDFGYGLYGFCQQLADGVLPASLTHLDNDMLKPATRNIEELIVVLFFLKKEKKEKGGQT